MRNKTYSPFWTYVWLALLSAAAPSLLAWVISRKPAIGGIVFAVGFVAAFLSFALCWSAQDGD